MASCDTTKKKFDTLMTTHEGTRQVKEAKVSILTRKYELVRMLEHETIREMFNWFTIIVNDLKSPGKT